MFFTKKSLLNSQLLNGFTDHHSHILPSVDDGVRRQDEALETLGWYEELGVQRVIFTPHIMEDYPKNTSEALRGEFERFRQLYNGSIELSLGAEYMLDLKFDSHLCGGDMLTLHKNYILVECSFAEAPLYLFDTIRSIMQRGYFVVLAHPERYLYLTSADYKQLKKMGVLFQLNLTSVLGAYGESVRRRAEQLLGSSMYDILGSDLHSLRYHSRLYATSKISKRIIAQLEKIKQSDIFKR